MTILTWQHPALGCCRHTPREKAARRCAPVEWSVATDETIGSKQRWSKKQKQDWEQTGAKTKSRLGAAGAGLSTRCHDKESNSHKTWKDMKCEHLTTTQEWAKLKRKRGATQEIFWFPNPLAVQSQMGTLSTQEQLLKKEEMSTECSNWEADSCKMREEYPTDSRLICLVTCGARCVRWGGIRANFSCLIWLESFQLWRRGLLNFEALKHLFLWIFAFGCVLI